MVYGEDTLFHSLLSPYLNCGLLVAKEVCDAAEAAYYSGHAPLNAVEGFIRQILGWREYVRGIYWLRMPEYASSNVLNYFGPATILLDGSNQNDLHGRMLSQYL
jgi:deoxyribodipyrimidine photolyase-related protein